MNPDGSIRRELRLPEYVFAEESLKSYKGKPIIVTHEAGKITKANVEDETIGTILTEGYQDGEDVRAEIIIHDTDRMRASGCKELSLGYDLVLIDEPGEWNGEPYDAIQTEIFINHLALVEEARAGKQARLNIDGSDKEILKGGKKMAKNIETRHDGEVQLSEEEMKEAIAMYLASKAKADCGAENADGEGAEEPTEEPQVTDGEGTEPAAEPTPVEPTKEEEPKAVDGEEPAQEPTNNGSEVVSKVVEVLTKVIEDLKAQNSDGANCTDCNKDGEEPTEEPKAEPDKQDSSDDNSQSMNNDSADEIVRQRLGICRVGDKLNLDGLDEMSIQEGKLAIINKVFPEMRMDGKDASYINAMYDIAANEVNREKTAGDQYRQIFNGDAKHKSNTTMAQDARQRMIEREGGNE